MGTKLGLTLRAVYGLRVFENRVLRGIFGLKRVEVDCRSQLKKKRGRMWQENGEECMVRSIITCTLHQILLG
jgi:hypothetical protein